MNAANTHTDLTTDAWMGNPASSSSHATSLEFEPASCLSAFVDGELTDAELDRWLATLDRESQGLEGWHSYQVIGDVLRASAPAVATKTSQDFLAGIRARLQVEASVVQPLSVPPVLPMAPPGVVGHARAPAANDAVFRWKMVAGLASLAAVMAVSWTVLGSAPSGVRGGAGAQLALVGANPGIAAPQLPESTAVVVNTPQGAVIRDVQLEALMAEHRQHGGMSALQMPAGFLRNATYDATGR
ncbi:MAG: sigma-E factor negative regulatory protein [Hydrogenophaga sp.]|uniref:sigma-E factor negative regulatory protein n=1 Tax=Hydrogenophaga sp. TaxID=1904254 RepID=UPI0027193CBF|nr:sigma-E factor negative regulatory protein [Hydrogenophaga sp.]MDO9479037.1 sigma-E factor negative regulatory protein [Hydrogenophaga sp.]MDP2096419.1 sigma-E factor negative regulatory protein [Hydrogenophaga sp.]MDP2220740.1 sigma-E factor negative regulatory protein [Hydrogenophaga sp.]MDP3805876.1 sigma-E factor negative regulatory protein [Hydrogenophaga sp.]